MAQAITSAVDGVLEKSQHKLRGLLRDLCETTALVFIQHQQLRTTQIFEEDDEDDERPTFTSNLGRYDFPVKDFEEETVFDVSDDEIQGFHHDCDVQVLVDRAYLGVTKQHMNSGLGDVDCHRQSDHEPPDRDPDKGHTYVDLVPIHKGLTNGSQFTRVLDERRHHLKEEKNKNLEHELHETHKKIRMLNPGSASLDKILSMGRTEKSTVGLGYQGESSNSQTVFVRAKSAEQNKTMVLSDEFSCMFEYIDANRSLPTENEINMVQVFGVFKEEVRIHDESNDFVVPQRESIKSGLSGCGIGVYILDKKIEVSPPHDIVKLERMDINNGHMGLIENSAYKSFSLPLSENITSKDEEAKGYVLVRALCCTRAENTFTANHEQLLSWWHLKIMEPDPLRMVLICCCSTFYRAVNHTSVVVFKTTVVLVFTPVHLFLHLSFSWIIHIAGILKKVATVFETALQRNLLKTAKRVLNFIQSAQRDEMPALAVIEGLDVSVFMAIHYKKTARILREKIVGISSEYRYSDDIPTKQVVGNNSSEFLLSSEIPRNFPTEFRGNKFPRKFRGPFVCRKCPQNIPRENIVGIFPRTFIDRCVLDIYTSIDRNIPTEIFLGIFRGTCPSVYSEEHVPRNIPREQFLGIF
ncbi:hypothetical protein F2Q68_00028062 [Brassica cretica]|uniref:Uncharacterized protein n=1 Tax=Brassica cretica TaxID=69181 RepID=A0A8S9I850_BRACR|nr:hypothetical protein F2Q68_00028062 [Brassica cretica]